ncbi:hypothetical protein [Bacillus sp. 165]|uniref:hypothetical protein n=1 Tax=Bacillus sp. 165 TaxID=1529117 RepID=UPI001ADD5AC5|nr:hypothetical protein [Bacillus sp. 165]
MYKMIRCVLYSTILFSSLFAVLSIQHVVRDYRARTDNGFPFLIYSPAMYGIIGILLGLTHFLVEQRKKEPSYIEGSLTYSQV